MVVPYTPGKMQGRTSRAEFAGFRWCELLALRQIGVNTVNRVNKRLRERYDDERVGHYQLPAFEVTSKRPFLPDLLE